MLPLRTPIDPTTPAFSYSVSDPICYVEILHSKTAQIAFLGVEAGRCVARTKALPKKLPRCPLVHVLRNARVARGGLQARQIVSNATVGAFAGASKSGAQASKRSPGGHRSGIEVV